MGGIMGFALGGLIGSLLFGGFGGGLFGGIGMLEILLIGGCSILPSPICVDASSRLRQVPMAMPSTGGGDAILAIRLTGYCHSDDGSDRERPGAWYQAHPANG